MLSSSDIIGEPAFYSVGEDETLLDIARRFDLGYIEMLAANPKVDPWLLERGSRLHLPSRHILPDVERSGIVVNLGDFRLYWFSGTGDIESWPIGIARDGFNTPLGSTQVVGKQENPVWWPTLRARKEDPDLPYKVPPGPDNPLGSHALFLGFKRIMIHGTDKPWGIGRRVSRGCIRMYPEDIETLYKRIHVGTPVYIVNQPVKFGWYKKQLYVEVHPSVKRINAIENGQQSYQSIATDFIELALTAAGDDRQRLDWVTLIDAAKEGKGIPVRIFY